MTSAMAHGGNARFGSCGPISLFILKLAKPAASTGKKKDSADPITSEQSLKATAGILKWKNNP